MTKRVQIVRHVAEAAAEFIGLEGEVTADKDNEELRLHDGVAPGGTRFLGRDANDQRYQARSVELDGLLGWEPNQRGFLVRIGASSYRLRMLAVNTEQMVLTNQNGYDGNPLIEFAGTITTDHTWTGDHEFTQPVVGTGGFVGNLSGSITGNVLGNLVGNVTGNLTGNAVGNHSGSFTGDLDVRGKVVLMDPGQIELAWLSTEAQNFIVNSGVPIGTVVMFAGPLTSIPLNWFLCDGTNGTPDLRSKFIVGAGAGGDYVLGDAGGALTHTHAATVDNGGSHSHTGTVGGTAITIAQMPAHWHANGVTDQNTNLVFSRGYVAAASATPKCIDDNGASGIYEGKTSTDGTGDTHSHSLVIDSGGSHTHTAANASTDHLPPYYALYYIMKGA